MSDDSIRFVARVYFDSFCCYIIKELKTSRFLAKRCMQYAYCKKLFLEAVQQTDEHYLDTMTCVLDDITRCMGLDPHLVLRRKSDEGV